jgi:hypothetical protein
LQTNIWYHVAQTYDGTTLKLYVNGALDGQLAATGAIVTTTEPVRMGGGGDGGCQIYNLNGILDEPSLYDRALSSNEIAAIYNAGSNGKCFTPTPPVITAQPTNQTVQVGGTATFNITAAGTPPLNYQWSCNGTNLAGATNATLALLNVQLTNAGNYSVLITNLTGATNSAAAALTVFGLPPFITNQPASQNDFVGGTATFTVTVSGTAPLNYQWSVNNTNLIGATNATLSLPNIQLTNAGNYSVLITNLYGATNSATAVLTVNPLPPCDPTPSGIVAWWQAEGNALDSAGTNNGTLVGGVTYTNGEVGQAFNFNGSDNLVVADAPALNPTNAMTIECWAYPRTRLSPVTWTQFLVSKDSDCSANREFQLIVGDSQVRSGSGDFRATVWTASGNKSLDGATVLQTNTWYHVAQTYDGATLKLYVNGKLDGQLAATGPMVTTTEPVRLGGGADNGCTAYNYNGILDEPAIYNRALSSNEIAAIYNAGSNGKCPLPPAIFTQPTNQTVNATNTSNTATFKVVAGGTPTLKYQWSFNGTNLVNGTNATLSLTNAQLVSAGNYSVQVMNNYGSTNSSNAVLTVLAPPVISAQPTNQTAAAGGTASFSSTVTGTSPLIFQWRFNGTNISGATNLVLVLPNVQLTNGGSYSLRITNSYGSATSSNALLAVQAPPFITGQPTNQAVSLGGMAGFSVTANGSTPLNYQWLFNGSNITNATNSMLTLTNIQLPQAGVYTVWVTNAYGSTVSSNAVLTLNLPPTITNQPAGQRVAIGCEVVFSVGASGTAPLAYQWWKPSSILNGQTSPILILTNVQTADFTNYFVVITNNFGSATSTNVALIQDQLPVANQDILQRPAGGDTKVQVSTLLANDTDHDGDTLTLTGVSSNSAAGGTVTWSGNWVYYQPLAGYTNSDVFTYTISDGYCGGIATGNVLVQVITASGPSHNFTINLQPDGSVRLDFAGIPGWTYRIQYADTLPPVNWMDLSTNTADSLGDYEYIDMPPANSPTRFYRSVSP